MILFDSPLLEPEQTYTIECQVSGFRPLVALYVPKEVFKETVDSIIIKDVSVSKEHLWKLTIMNIGKKPVKFSCNGLERHEVRYNDEGEITAYWQRNGEWSL